MKRAVFFLLIMAFNARAGGFCFNAAGNKYHIDPLLLRAIAEVESGLNPSAINLNKHHGKIISIDYGVMQINSTHLPELQSMGITRDRLLQNPCLNIQVGAWILARQLAYGGVRWDSVGAYNAGFALHGQTARLKYSRTVYQHYKSLLLAERGIRL
ncbi:lytic transglycosylase domain-containing protein [Citrobacter koseri]|uniref:lytic transglycosylase domain-containing protein n=1 Tax=Citrobacter koseri TaxID=545 RepID=UPI001F1C925A|nr:lytic transglycosylase domain-containing protein [Citrobacter koseri]